MNLKKTLPTLLPTLLAGGSAFLLLIESDLLRRMEELNLFLPTTLHYHTLAIYPGGTLSWAATFLTQFFFHPLLGVGAMALMWALIALLVLRLFRLDGVWTGLALLAPLALLACFTQTGYWIYYMKLPGHAFVPTLGVLVSLILACVHKAIPNRYARIAWVVVVGLAGYPLMGAWSFIALALMAMAAKSRKDAFLTFPLVLALIVIVPQVACRQFYAQTEPAYIYMAGLPSFQFSNTNCTQYHLPYIALALAFVLMAVPSRLPRLKAVPVVVTTVCLAAFALLVYTSWYKDKNFHREVSMTLALEAQDYERVLAISRDGAADTIPPTRVMTMFKNLALFRLHRAGDEMYLYPEGATPPNAPWNVRMTQTGGKLLYYHYGKENFCYRWAMEDAVEYGWTVDGLRLMTKASILNKDYEVARKYINLLRGTLFHKDWAERYATYLYNEKAQQADPEMEFITHLRVPADRLDGDNTLIELYLLQTFANGHGADPLYEENTLLCALQMKDIDLFWPRFAQYAARHSREANFHMPRHFQEAAYLFCQLEPQRENPMWPGLTNQEAIQRIPFDQSVRDDYEHFMQWNQQISPAVQARVQAQFQPRIDRIQAQDIPLDKKQAQLDTLRQVFDSTYTATLAAKMKAEWQRTYYYAYFLVRNQQTN